MPLSGIHIETILIKSVEQIGNNRCIRLLAGLDGFFSRSRDMKICLKPGTSAAFGAMLGVGKTIVEWPLQPSADTTGS